MPDPTSTSLKKCIPITTLETATFAASNSDNATANAVVEWPDGNENLSRVTICAQQCGSISRGRTRQTIRFNLWNRTIPSVTAHAAASMAWNLAASGESSTEIP